MNPEEIKLRDNFAGLALSGILASDTFVGTWCKPEGRKIIADLCYMLADAMLKERKA